MHRVPWYSSLALSFALSAGIAACQTQSNSAPPVIPPPGVRNAGSDGMGNYDPNLMHRQLLARRDDAKRRMTVNAARLLDLTQQLHTDLQTHEPTADDSRRLDEIAKLARAVRDGMRQ